MTCHFLCSPLSDHCVFSRKEAHDNFSFWVSLEELAASNLGYAAISQDSAMITRAYMPSWPYSQHYQHSAQCLTTYDDSSYDYSLPSKLTDFVPSWLFITLRSVQQ